MFSSNLYFYQVFQLIFEIRSLKLLPAPILFVNVVRNEAMSVFCFMQRRVENEMKEYAPSTHNECMLCSQPICEKEYPWKN